jgi:small subunit ribosomal protein S4
MARNLAPACKQCRREGTKLFLKGDKCASPKCPLAVRNYPPGVHGPNGRPRLTPYGTQLRQKQQAKRFYMLMEQQFRNYYDKAKKLKGDTSATLLRLLETRLDNVIYRLGFVPSHKLARQLVGHNYFFVNGKPVNIPSYQLKLNDVVSINPLKKDKKVFVELSKKLNKAYLPQWLSIDPDKLSGSIISVPSKEDINVSFDIRMIIEFYSR